MHAIATLYRQAMGCSRKVGIKSYDSHTGSLTRFDIGAEKRTIGMGNSVILIAMP